MGISVTQLLIILAIVIVLFGTKRLKSMGGDVGSAIKGFRSALKDGNEDKKVTDADASVIESEVASKQEHVEK